MVGRTIIKERILTAVVALPLLVLLIAFAGVALFNGILCVVSGVALYEFYRMGLPSHRRAESLLAVMAGILLMMSVLFGRDQGMPLAGLVVSLFVVTLVYLFRFHDMPSVSRDLGVTVLGLFYVPVLLSHVGLLRGLMYGREWVFLVLAVVMSSDSLAYFVGRQWGRHRLYEAVSPKKSIEGSIGGLCGGLLGALICKVTFFSALNLVDVALVGVGVGAFSQLGDLVESLLKRSFDVKDSGQIFPGHGGLLDRLDSLLFAFPLTYYYALWVY